jgi:hypothetical protein
METNLEEKVTIELSKGELLVIFEFLSGSFDSWRAGGNQDIETFALAKPDSAERTALGHLEGRIESTLVEVFASNYNDLIDRAKQNLTSA